MRLPRNRHLNRTAWALVAFTWYSLIAQPSRRPRRRVGDRPGQSRTKFARRANPDPRARRPRWGFAPGMPVSRAIFFDAAPGDARASGRFFVPPPFAPPCPGSRPFAALRPFGGTRVPLGPRSAAVSRLNASRPLHARRLRAGAPLGARVYARAQKPPRHLGTPPLAGCTVAQRWYATCTRESWCTHGARCAHGGTRGVPVWV